jgi:7,8-dihydropterin-6-yl-methyl-4-(beta-D-ribofuranosyl)aminobenzene 5'-phosphate synthase
MKLRVLYDNEAEQGFKSGWGFSCLIEHDARKILFDTGWDGNALLFNMKKIGVAMEEVHIIALSHDHWDHLGGLASVIHPEVHVYVPSSFSKRLKGEISQRANLHEVTDAGEITRSVYTTGELGSTIKEQSLALGTKDGFIVVTGCAHPGLDVILDTAEQFGKLRGVIGGFHGFDRIDRLRDLSLIIPCHCTARKKDIMERYPGKVGKCGAGQTIHLNENEKVR